MIHDDGIQTVQVRTTDRFINLKLHGDRALDGPVHLMFQVAGLTNIATAAANLAKLADLTALPVRWPKQSRHQLVLRDALIAVDLGAAGASYRDIAVAIVGKNRVTEDWNSSTRSLKDRMRRALVKGRTLRHGGYRRLIARGCRF